MKAFVTAMDCEAQCVIDNLSNPSEETMYGRRVVRGSLGGEDVVLVVSGIGKANTAASVQLALQLGADLIVNVGVAGGLSQAMDIGDIYEVSSAVQYDFDLASVKGTAVGTLDERSTPYIPVGTTGRLGQAILATGDRFNDSDVDNDFIVNELKCSLRDMEGAAMAQVCERAGVRCHSFKCVSDVRGRGSAPGQYAENLKKCLARLTAAVPELFSYVR